MAKLTQDQIKISHAWLHDIFVWGGLVSTPIRDINSNAYMLMYAQKKPDGEGLKAAIDICEAVKTRPVIYKKFQEFDRALEVLASRNFIPDLHAKSNLVHSVKKDASMLAKYIANLCAEHKYYWTNTAISSYEMEQILQTNLGKALWEYGCFTSQLAKPSTRVGTNSAKVSANRQAGQAPQNNYKSSGPQSTNVKCLVGQPNNKLQAQSPVSWCIEADKIGKNTPNIFVKPLDSAACPGGSAKIYMGSGNGYTDCKCWFDNKQIAVDFLNKSIAKFGNKFTNIHLTQKKSDANGYYEIKTEFGNCGIKASKLNEALQEAIKEDITKEIEANFNSFEEAYYKEL